MKFYNLMYILNNHARLQVNNLLYTKNHTWKLSVGCKGKTAGVQSSWKKPLRTMRLVPIPLSSCNVTLKL